MGEACFSADMQTGTMPFAEGFNPAWYAVQTSYRCEQRVAAALTAKGVKTYLPILQEVRQWKDRRKVIAVPAFSGYLFVHHEPSLRNRVRVLETSGIVRLLGGNHAPIPVSEPEIEAVRRALGSGVPCDRCDELQPGALVRVTRGPLAGVQGRLVRIKSGLRLVMTISVFSQAISAELGLNDVEALHDRLAADFAVPAN
jgi:transcription antitermination factor NusG